MPYRCEVAVACPTDQRVAVACPTDQKQTRESFSQMTSLVSGHSSHKWPLLWGEVGDCEERGDSEVCDCLFAHDCLYSQMISAVRTVRRVVTHNRWLWEERWLTTEVICEKRGARERPAKTQKQTCESFSHITSQVACRLEILKKSAHV